MTIQLAPDLEIRLAEKAREKGTTPDLLADLYLRERLFGGDAEGEANGSPAPRNLAEFLEGYVGVFNSRDFAPDAPPMSVRTGEQFTDILVEKHKQGRL